MKTTKRWSVGLMIAAFFSLFAVEAFATLSATEVLSLIAGDAAAGDNLGWSVDVDGDRAVIGAIGDDDAGSSSGSAYVFFNDPVLGWVEEKKLVMPGAAAGDRFGESVGIEGDVVVVGASNDDAMEPTNFKGSAWVFTRDSNTGVWDNGVELAPTTSALSYGNYGISVAIDSATIVVGVSFDNQMGISAGAAHVFELSGSLWEHTAELLPPAGANQNFATSVAIDVDTIVIGAPHWTAAGTGAAFAFNRADGFSARETLPTTGNSPGDRLGWSVRVSGDLVVVGAPYDDDAVNGDEAGSITIIDRSSGNWLVDEKLTASDGGETDHFGQSVAVYGTTIAAGAPWTDGSFPNHGSFYLFASADPGWTEDVNIMSATAGANLGQSVALELPTLLVGAHGVFPGGEGVIYDVEDTMSGNPVLAGTAICGDVAHYAWVRFGATATDANIVYRSCDIGGGCSSAMTLVGAPTVEANPAVACAGDTVMVMWEDYRTGDSDLAYRRSTDGGANFAPLQFLVKGPSDEAEPTLAMSGDVAVVVWEDDRNGNDDLASRRSNDAGASWDPLTFVVRSPFDDKDPVVDLDGSAALMAWVDVRSGNQDIAYRRSGDAALTWQPLVFLVRAGTAEKDATVVVDGTTMMIAWSDQRSGNEDLAYRRSVNSGVSFAGLEFLVKAPSDDSEPSIGASGLAGILTWVDERSGNKNISFRHSDDGGASFGATGRLVAAGTDEFGPACDLEGDLAACVWMDTRTGEPEPQTRHSLDGGMNWLPRFELEP